MSAIDSRIEAFLARHPRLIGASFTALVLLSQLATVVANDDTSHIGP